MSEPSSGLLNFLAHAAAKYHQNVVDSNGVRDALEMLIGPVGNNKRDASNMATANQTPSTSTSVNESHPSKLKRKGRGKTQPPKHILKRKRNLSTFTPTGKRRMRFSTRLRDLGLSG